LTDQDYTIIALLRAVPPTDTLKVAVGETYNVKSVLTDFQKVDVDQVKEVLSKAGPKDTLKKILNIGFGKLCMSWI
jgi:predicted ribosome quality control (RQC) complex YloA/Tae2 family protein